MRTITNGIIPTVAKKIKVCKNRCTADLVTPQTEAPPEARRLENGLLLGLVDADMVGDARVGGEARPLFHGACGDADDRTAAERPRGRDLVDVLRPAEEGGRQTGGTV